MSRRIVLLAFVASVLAWSLAPAPASASCIAEPVIGGGIGSADLVFVGTVVELDNHGRYATFAVEEQWKGSTPPEVEIRGGPPDPGDDGRFASATTERRYELGVRYLVTAFEGDTFTGDTGVFSDNNCSGTGVWSDDLARLRPVDATVIERDEPIRPRTSEDSSPPYALIALTTVLVAGGCLYLLFRRGSIAYRAREDEERSSQAE